jgi:hypothetical protein
MLIEMKKIFLVISLLAILFTIEAQDSIQIKKDTLVSRIKNNFSGDWSYDLLDRVAVIKWDTVCHLPIAEIRSNFYRKNKNTIDTFTSYFFNSGETDTVIKAISGKYLKKLIAGTFKDSIPPSFTFPFLSSNSQWFVVSFNSTSQGFEDLKSKFKSNLKLEEISLTIEDVRIEEEKDEPLPPPPPPPKKKKKKTKNL